MYFLQNSPILLVKQIELVLQRLNYDHSNNDRVQLWYMLQNFDNSLTMSIGTTMHLLVHSDGDYVMMLKTYF